jgi:hypothetical protein
MCFIEVFSLIKRMANSARAQAGAALPAHRHSLRLSLFAGNIIAWITTRRHLQNAREYAPALPQNGKNAGK